MSLLVDHALTAPGVPFACGLARHGDRPALLTPAGAVSYRDLADRVRERVAILGPGRRLVLLTGANRVDTIVTYLAALAAGHPLLLAPADNPAALARLTATYDPDVTFTDDHAHPSRHRRRSAHDLHPDLALLLSTSGSTGSPRLVRLSHDNLQANAESIADYLGITSADRPVTTLPMHYCYGLSVINSHLLRGACMILNDLSVADAAFWQRVRDTGATSFAGVPYTFDLLDRVGFADMTLPTLRYVTQAGGRLAPERIRRYAELGRSKGFDLVVMYGQTEATARIAYLPPDLAERHPHTIGVAVPGGSLHLHPLPDDEGAPDTGELVYRGRNVMLGYAEHPADLGRGRTVTELRTGDIARRTPEGLYEIVGRRTDFLKIFGLRLDLRQIESMLRTNGYAAFVTGDDERLLIAVEGDADRDHLHALVSRHYGLPRHVVDVHLFGRLPRLASGKPDYPAIRALAATPPQPTPAAAAPDLTALFAEVLGQKEVTAGHSFVDLGGDSLSYVEMSIRLEQALGHLPPNWHTTPIRDLRPAPTPPPTPAQKDGPSPTVPDRRRGWRSRVDTTVALRAIAIVLIVGSHIQVYDLPGGAHLLLGVAGYNFARFQLTPAPRRQRIATLARSTSRIVLAATTWIGAMYLLTDDYTLGSVFLAGYLTAPADGTNYWWHFWFIEALVYYLLILLAALSLPFVDRLERRRPFALPLTLAALGLVSRYQLVPDVHLPTPVVVFWLFALGWAAAKATNVAQKLCVTLAIVATVPTFFGDPGREAVIIGGLLLMIWVADLPSVPLLNRAAAALAASSIYIYLTHWQIFRPVDDISLPLALLASLAFGIAYAMLVPRLAGKAGTVAVRWCTRAAHRVSQRRSSPPGSWARRSPRAATRTDWKGARSAGGARVATRPSHPVRRG
ncbi:AMP-binding protein [Micromonospora sp. NPDC002717]|uniref:AMP-binding protein n=1 Tax=Micromonospora sp. NPDC002717 TaxID=3154424 RepID=UPI0033331C1B